MQERVWKEHWGMRNAAPAAACISDTEAEYWWRSAPWSHFTACGCLSEHSGPHPSTSSLHHHSLPGYQQWTLAMGSTPPGPSSLCCPSPRVFHTLTSLAFCHLNYCHTDLVSQRVFLILCEAQHQLGEHVPTNLCLKLGCEPYRAAAAAAAVEWKNNSSSKLARRKKRAPQAL